MRYNYLEEKQSIRIYQRNRNGRNYWRRLERHERRHTERFIKGDTSSTSSVDTPPIIGSSNWSVHASNLFDLFVGPHMHSIFRRKLMIVIKSGI